MARARMGWVLALLLWPLGAMAQATVVLDNGALKVYKVKGDFAETFEFLQAAIGDQGIKINNISYIGKMLQRTAEAVGTGKEVYANANALEFCSAVISREMMEADPNNIVLCPYIIYIYELAAAPGELYVAYRKPEITGNEATRKALAKVTALLESIIGSVLN